MLRKVLVTLSFSLFAILTSAVAQKNEVGILLGGAFSPDTHGNSIVCAPVGPCTLQRNTFHVDSKVAFEGVYARRVTEGNLAALYVELAVAGVPSRELHLAGNTTTTFVPHDFSSVFLTPSLKAQFLPKAVFSPFLSLGGGIAHFSSTIAFKDVSSSAGSTTTGAFQAGAGIDIKTPIKVLDFRAEVRDFISGRPPFISTITVNHRHNIFAGGGPVFHF